jgi:hypothetical protein
VSSTLGDGIRAAFDRIRVGLSGQLEADLSASTSDILRVVADEQRRALLEATERTAATVRAEAQQQLAVAREEVARDREELARQREELQRSSTSEIAKLERMLGEVRDELDVARRTLNESQTTRQTLEQVIHVQRQDIERVKQDLEQHNLQFDQSHRDLERRETEEATRREFQESIDRALRERDQARVDSESVSRELQHLRNRLEHAARLMAAFRTLDDATSLGDILERLARSACLETGRTAVFLVNGGKLRGWRALGFPAERPIVGSDFAPAESDVVGRAVRSGAGQQHKNGDATRLPAFAGADGPRDALAVPVQVGGSVIAVLYADAARADRSEDPEWLDTIDAMTKHAGRVLEAMTIRQAAALWTPRGGVARSSRE